MKQLIILILAISTSLPAQASSCVDTEFRTTRVDLLNCANRGAWNYRDLLYHKGITRLLDSYLAETGLDEALSPKRLRLAVYPEFWATPVFAFDQNQDYYSIEWRGTLDPRLFLATLHYFTAADWLPFPGDQSMARSAASRQQARKITDDAVLRELDEVLRNRIGEIDLSRVTDRRFVVMNLGQLQIIFKNGTLFYELDGIRLKESVQDPIPTRIGIRYLLGSDRGISVYESEKLIAEIELKREILHTPFYPVASRDGNFVDFHSGDGFVGDGLFLIYSFKTNTFHPIRRATPRGWPPGRDSSPCEDVKVRHICAANALTQIGFFVLSHDAG